MKRNLANPGAGHYDRVADSYIKYTMPKAKQPVAMSLDKLKRKAFPIQDLAPDASNNVNKLTGTADYCRYSQAGMNHDFSQVVDRDKVIFLKSQVHAQKQIQSSIKAHKMRIADIEMRLEMEKDAERREK